MVLNKNFEKKLLNLRILWSEDIKNKLFDFILFTTIINKINCINAIPGANYIAI